MAFMQLKPSSSNNSRTMTHVKPTVMTTVHDCIICFLSKWVVVMESITTTTIPTR